MEWFLPKRSFSLGPPGTGKTHFAFEQELVNKENYLVTEEDIHAYFA